MNKKYGFTITEVLIVFTVVGVLAAMLIPMILHATPNQEVLLAKKAYNTLSRTVEALINGPYETNDADNALVAPKSISGLSGANLNNARDRYFCNQMSQILNVKTSDCTNNTVQSEIPSNIGREITFDTPTVTASKRALVMTTTTNGKLDYDTLQGQLDTACEAYFSQTAAFDTYTNFQTIDGIYWGIQLTNFDNTNHEVIDGINIYTFHNLVCMYTGKKPVANTAPDLKYVYGAGIRKDGKILVGTKLQNVVEQD